MKFQCIELSASRNPADDRPLLQNGSFGTGTFSQCDVAEFSASEFALQAGERASNRRAGCSLWVNGESRKRSA